MKIEDIEKESLEYAEIATPTYVNGDFVKCAIADAFERGASWRIDSVWHEASEEPERDRIYTPNLETVPLIPFMIQEIGRDFHVELICNAGHM